MRFAIAFAFLCIPLLALGDQLDNDLKREMAAEKLPALTFAVVRSGKIVRTGHYGYANVEWQTKTTDDTKFEIASMSKMFIATAVRMLIDEGKLDPEDLLSKYFDGLPDSWKPLKIRHLLDMSSGIPEDWGTDLIPYNADVIEPSNDEAMLGAFEKLKFDAPIGTAFHYTSPSYAILGMLVTKLTGRPFAEFVRDRIFAPAGMNMTSYLEPYNMVPQRAEGYRVKDGQLVRGWYLGGYLHARADVGILSTSTDIAKWLIVLEAGKIIPNPQRLWQYTVGDNGRPLDYSNGWFMETLSGHRVIDHSGGFRTGFHTMIYRFPDDNLGVVLMTNTDSSGARALAGRVIHEYIHDIPNMLDVREAKDDNPADTEACRRALQALGEGHIALSLMEPDALEPWDIGEVQGLLSSIKRYTFLGRRTLAKPISMHGHRLVQYTSLLASGDDTHRLTLYRDENGKIACCEVTA